MKWSPRRNFRHSIAPFSMPFAKNRLSPPVSPAPWNSGRSPAELRSSLLPARPVLGHHQTGRKLGPIIAAGDIHLPLSKVFDLAQIRAFETRPIEISAVE